MRSTLRTTAESKTSDQLLARKAAGWTAAVGSLAIAGTWGGLELAKVNTLQIGKLFDFFTKALGGLGEHVHQAGYIAAGVTAVAAACVAGRGAIKSLMTWRRASTLVEVMHTTPVSDENGERYDISTSAPATRSTPRGRAAVNPFIGIPHVLEVESVMRPYVGHAPIAVPAPGQMEIAYQGAISGPPGTILASSSNRDDLRCVLFGWDFVSTDPSITVLSSITPAVDTEFARYPAKAAA